MNVSDLAVRKCRILRRACANWEKSRLAGVLVREDLSFSESISTAGDAKSPGGKLRELDEFQQNRESVE